MCSRKELISLLEDARKDLAPLSEDGAELFDKMIDRLEAASETSPSYVDVLYSLKDLSARIWGIYTEDQFMACRAWRDYDKKSIEARLNLMARSCGCGENAATRITLMDRCAGCGTEDAVRTCTKCTKVKYCSKLCQKNDWKEHKPVCR